MKKKIRVASDLKPEEARLIEQLRQHPEMMERVQSILEITSSTAGPLKTADEVEELLIQEMRQLGNSSMSQWATHAEERVSKELKEQDPTVRSRKKNAEVVVCLWIGKRARADLAPLNPELRSAFAAAIGSETSRTLEATGTGADGLWLRAGL
jgi:hypothetical protein